MSVAVNLRSGDSATSHSVRSEARHGVAELAGAWIHKDFFMLICEGKRYEIIDGDFNELTDVRMPHAATWTHSIC